MIKCYFVTGTDTEMGKIVASRAMLQAANLTGYCGAGYKPAKPIISDRAMGTRRRIGRNVYALVL